MPELLAMSTLMPKSFSELRLASMIRTSSITCWAASTVSSELTPPGAYFSAMPLARAAAELVETCPDSITPPARAETRIGSPGSAEPRSACSDSMSWPTRTSITSIRR